jgi:CRISPR-associated exonuclease Cas4
MSDYPEDEYLQLSGIQHFAFCRRQWALIHLEQQWVENLRTMEGDILHERAHEEGLREKRGPLLTVRQMRVSSASLGVSGMCDVVEFHASETGAPLLGREGKWQPYPVEYKRGLPKEHDADRLQLCCEAMCLEEMLAVGVPEGALFYGEQRRRERVEFSSELREKVRDMLKEMHDYARKGYTPKVRTGPFCRACSLNEICLPKLCRAPSARMYMEDRLHEEPTDETPA